MEPRHYDVAGDIDYDAIKSCASELRRQAIDQCWSALAASAAAKIARLRRGAAAHLPVRRWRTAA